LASVVKSRFLFLSFSVRKAKEEEKEEEEKEKEEEEKKKKKKKKWPLAKRPIINFITYKKRSSRAAPYRRL